MGRQGQVSAKLYRQRRELREPGYIAKYNEQQREAKRAKKVLEIMK